MAKKIDNEKKPEFRLKPLIRYYIIKVGELGEELTKKNPQLEFGFLFYHPQGFTKRSDGKIIYHGRSFQANKPKNEDFVVISHRTTLDKNHQELIEKSTDKKKRLFNDLRKIFLLKNIEYSTDIVKNSYTISNRIYPEKNGQISIENFYNTLRNIFHADIYAVILINEQLSGKVDYNGKDFQAPYHI